MNLKELKTKPPAELLTYAEELRIENASSLRKQEMMFAILKQLAENDMPIFGDGVLEVLQDGFGFLRSPEANYLPGPDDIYVSPARCGGSACAPAIPSRARSARRRTASATSRCCGSPASTSPIRWRSATASTSTI